MHEPVPRRLLRVRRVGAGVLRAASRRPLERHPELLHAPPDRRAGDPEPPCGLGLVPPGDFEHGHEFLAGSSPFAPRGEF